jgi:3-oxoacyl-(acyl-carrier-protein) synthase
MSGMQIACGVFVNDSYCISPQVTHDRSFFEKDVISYTGNCYVAVEPLYGSLIPAGVLRRMGKAVRMGVGAGMPMINSNPEVDAIILGTANGGLEDCLKFLNQIVDYEEGTLTPTNFVQSTPNAVAGSLALMSRNTGYNVTHVHKGLAFESALLDALLLLSEKRAGKVLLGAVEEISEYNYNIDLLAGSFKVEEVTSEKLLRSDSPGTVCGEGAAMFVLSKEKTEQAKAEIVDVHQLTYPDQEKLPESVLGFLNRNGLLPIEIDTLILGLSGDNRNDHWFTGLHESLFPGSNVFTYKNLVGDYPTSSAFATWLAVEMLSGRTVPRAVGSSTGSVRNVLVYNHYKGVQHGLILLRAC